MAKDLQQIANTIYFNLYQGKNLLAINKTGDKEERSTLFFYDDKRGIWVELNKMILRTQLMKDEELETTAQRNQVINNVAVLAEITSLYDNFEFNSDRNRVVLQNGVFNIETQEIEEFDRNLFSTIQLPFEYDPHAKCPQFLEFLTEIMLGDKEMVTFLLEWLGYLFAPTTKYEALLIWIGEGANGKSALSKLFKLMLGKDNISNIRLTNLFKTGSSLRMFNKLVNFSVETEMGRDHIVLDTGIIKNIVSGEEVVAKQLYKDEFEFKPFARQILICNDMPIVKDTSEGWIRRLHMIPFDYTVPVDKRIPDIEKKLFEEASGIFNLAMEHYQNLISRDRFELPTRVKTAVEQYQIDTNSPAEFVLNKYKELFADDPMPFNQFRSEYYDWCLENGYKPYGRLNMWKQIERFFRSRREIGIRPTKFNGSRNEVFVQFLLLDDPLVDLKKREQLLGFMGDA